MKNIRLTLITLVAALVLYSCAPAEGDYPGSEYMPDMGHSLAVEGNVYTYYYYNTWDSASVIKLKDLANPGLPTNGTVPRGYAGIGLADAKHHTDMMKALRGEDRVNSMPVPVNGNVPYYYEDTEEERTRAIAEIIDNPFPITADGLERGEDLYNKFCGICHGEKGDGLGWLVAEENTNAKYPAAPANFLLDDHANSSNGRYYHAIMHGKNVMGGYSDKVSYEERWQIIHWIRALQAKDKKMAYNENENTLNPLFGMPNVQYLAMMGSAINHDDETHTEGEHHSDDAHHSDEAGHDDGHHEEDSHHNDGDHGHGGSGDH
ncbi:MAG: cytochrome c [Saprospiraceae bacterium]|jgi:cytochrome c553|nr:cytochrome c [Saprospiraceae bacterium]